jgi:hypothetical protein
MNTARTLSMLCHPGSAVIWTRHRGDPDLTPDIRRWLTESGFDEMTFDALDNANKSGIGTAVLMGDPVPWKSGHRFFTFVR